MFLIKLCFNPTSSLMSQNGFGTLLISIFIDRTYWINSTKQIQNLLFLNNIS